MKEVLQYNAVKVNAKIYIVKRDTSCYLSRDSSEKLSIIALIGSVSAHPELFKGLGTIPHPYDVKLKPNAQLFSVDTPRRISLPPLPKVKDERRRLEASGVIGKVDKPTEWCTPLVPVLKPPGSVRICVDYTRLNESVLRERHTPPAVDEILAQMGESTVFSKLDANSRFHQIKLTEQSQLYTTFMSPLGRYCYTRLPFGINSVPEYYQKQIQCIIQDVPGVVCLMDDIVIHDKTTDKHDGRLEKVLDKLTKIGVTLNKAKCAFSKNKITFLGHVVGPKGIEYDPNKVCAIRNFACPKIVMG